MSCDLLTLSVHTEHWHVQKETAGRRQGGWWLQVLGKAEESGVESKGQGVSETWRTAVARASVRSVLPYLVQLSCIFFFSAMPPVSSLRPYCHFCSVSGVPEDLRDSGWQLTPRKLSLVRTSSV